MSDSEDPELEEELQAADELLQDMQNDAQSEPQPRPVRWKKRDRREILFLKDHQPVEVLLACHVCPEISINVHVKKLVMLPVSTQQKVLSQYIKEVPGTEVLPQELLQLLEDGEEDAAMTCETASESAATHLEIRNMVSLQKWKEARPCLIDNMLATLDPQSHRFGCCLCKGQTMCVTAQQSFFDITKAAPGMSLKAFVKMLDERTAHFGRTGRISADAFSKSFVEWSAVKFEVDRMCKEPCFSCPACTPDVLAVSVDGNRKLYRIQSNTRSRGKGCADLHLGQQQRSRTKKSTGKLDEEGMEIAVSRHGVLLAALNMFRGEIFAYPLFLQRKLAASVPGHITFLCSNVACKYVPYLTKVAQLRNLLSMRPFLSVMHAKAHIWKCEIKWGGAFQDGAGSTVGKEVGQKLIKLMAALERCRHEQRSLSSSSECEHKVFTDKMKHLAAAVDDYNKLAEPTKQIVSSDALKQTDIWLWQSTSEPAADLQTKRKVFEKVMAVRRLREEEMILCREMRHHRTVLQMRSVVLGTISSDSSLVGMSEDAQKGLRSLVSKKQSELKAEMLKIKDTYKRILSHQPLLEMDSEEEEDIPDDATESDLSTSDED
ncbi:hypothetical protein ACER0C_003609 [Sarotherodon galilaeus]